MEQNVMLEQAGLNFSDLYSSRISAKVDYLTDLNRGGGRILKSSNMLHPLWPRILGRSCCSPDAIFFPLREKPEFVC
jgi:hypothetical protein